VKNEQASALSAFISPNPGTGIFKLKTTSFVETLDIEIYSSTGMLIKKDVSFSIDSDINLSAQPSGLYYVVLSTSGSQFVVKLIKE
jgi:hypothetical protein